MSKQEYILDLGSHSAKLYKKDIFNVIHLNTITWEILEVNEVNLQLKLAELIDPILKEDNYVIKAIGTAAMRRNNQLADILHKICSLIGISFRVISQKDEAKLIKKAIINSNIPPHLDIINVGGGSIQIISNSKKDEHLLDFGISDLNKQFNLVNSRNIKNYKDCIQWIYEKLPLNLGEFCYTGGEKIYLEHFNVPIIGDYCYQKDFEIFANDLFSYDKDTLLLSSPFDSKWMNGAIASNCIVIASLKRAKANKFYPSNLNIAHGFYQLI